MVKKDRPPAAPKKPKKDRLHDGPPQYWDAADDDGTLFLRILRDRLRADPPVTWDNDHPDRSVEAVVRGLFGCEETLPSWAGVSVVLDIPDADVHRLFYVDSVTASDAADNVDRYLGEPV